MEQKLLIVDDEAHIRMLIEQTLQELEDEDIEFCLQKTEKLPLKLFKMKNHSLYFWTL